MVKLSKWWKTAERARSGLILGPRSQALHGTPRLRPLTDQPRIARARAELDMILPSDCAKVSWAKSFTAARMML
jgi:hypothetical protein